MPLERLVAGGTEPISEDETCPPPWLPPPCAPALARDAGPANISARFFVTLLPFPALAARPARPECFWAWAPTGNLVASVVVKSADTLLSESMRELVAAIARLPVASKPESETFSTFWRARPFETIAVESVQQQAKNER
jgi:hypothetical protein